MKRVDLDDLRAKAEVCGGKASRYVCGHPSFQMKPPHELRFYDVLTEPDGAAVYERCLPGHADFAVATQPSVVIALLDHITDLRDALAQARDFIIDADDLDSDRRSAVKDYRTTLEQGAVLE